ncbi:type I secretion membrane fusion protein, HlyD family [Aminobacter sp. Y103A]|jgi:HlyD family secretion protein|uniref:Membrane fusion protein (MFP) family protein n=1 Tax=Aminobacter aminovorans TaxID=83263 RepID=A0AAC9ASN5_AMIAI|nr:MULTISPECIES: HlyD family type I secretion periplasmic adaptor subunit [Aminobacter]AMS43558.1 Type I secretion membrane fusion protein, HlyD family [Aminobacter aminovorans]MBB3705301.1 HlyD family secretion protein [Aminobacter aminovorans]MRX33385.1 HlyD family type I secretion periplasmic adaptor subunit [Aminobacter sp. MDW-2]QNH33556.1 HlyD family type I secretion periplasmic adaptor subunit [Aminobacter sp. MDW-2]BBD36921.1 type I secretion membrane fusion protein, HlyD family [Amino
MTLVTNHFSADRLKAARDLATSAKTQMLALLDKGAMPVAGATPQQQRLRKDIRRNVRLGGFAALALVGGLGLWAATSSLSGAVVAAGHLVVDSNVKAVQHPQGGVVGALNVHNGSMVSAGEVLVRLDDTVAKANLAIVDNGLDELMARRARLIAERDGTEAVAYPAELTARAADPAIAQLIEGENKLFALRRQARDGQVSQLRERIAQFREEISGVEAQQKSKKQEIALIKVELAGMEELWKKKLVPISRLADRQRAQAQLDGEDGQLTAAAAQTRGRISETELAIIQIDQDMRSQVAGELREIDAKAGELRERQVAAEQSLKQIDIRAPQAGRVHQLAIHTVGGVVTPGEAIMQIVPTADALVVEARVAPQDIDQVRIGQPATLRLSAFNQQTTPEVDGTVDRVSPDMIEDQKAGLSYYAVRIALSAKSLEQAGSPELKPGMPAEVFLKTTDRTVLSYLFKPLTDQASRAFRSD